MIRLSLFLIAAVLTVFFAVLNPHPVVISFFPDDTLLVPLRAVVLCALLAGFMFGFILFGIEIAGLYLKIHKLKKKIGLPEKKPEVVAAPATSLPAVPTEPVVSALTPTIAESLGTKEEGQETKDEGRNTKHEKYEKRTTKYEGLETKSEKTIKGVSSFFPENAVSGRPSSFVNPAKEQEPLESIKIGEDGDIEELLSEKDKIRNAIKWLEEGDKLFMDDEEDNIPNDKLEKVKNMIGTEQ
ncbi:MAG: hypothetical protein LHV68_05985 [Elusimicrobia bacterium]|nr:hypothetical protein [Candidatus Liberimonas magnetica]